MTPYVTAAVNRSTDLAPDVNVNRPPSVLSVVTDTTAVEVQLQANHPTYFVRIFGIGSIPISARAVARQGGIGSTACILALGPASCSGTEPVQFSGNGTAVLNDCSVHANGDCNPSVEVGNNTTVTADCITGEQELADATLQNYVGTPPATSTGLFVECPDGPLGGQGSIPDPYATISVDPSKFTDPCDFASLPGSNWMERFAEAINPISTAHAGNHGGSGGPPGPTVINLSPGIHCSFHINSSQQAVLAPGVYYVRDTSIFVQGSIIADGVVLVQISTSATGYSLNINGNDDTEIFGIDDSDLTGGSASLYADLNPSPADWEDMFYANLTNGTNSGTQFNGTANTVFSGTIYAPNDKVTFNGDNSTTTANTCFAIVAAQVVVSGSAGLSTEGCGGPVTETFANTTVGLVE